ncbi:MAG TPA: hypothetical protein DD381_02145 [Lentisphaeria bacterium]|nr:MAG: hypothetical protein A2X47_08890 [Lentisphaerae bacterium GWF2_38_69]HBM15137.1 hypothetical protein [Lentisphaeria bacterium]
MKSFFLQKNKIYFLLLLSIIFLKSTALLAYDSDTVKILNPKQSQIIKEYISAIQKFDRLIDYEPNNSEAYAKRALCKDLIGDWKGAIEDYSTASKLDPKKAEGYLLAIGSINNKLGNFSEAVHSYDKAIALNQKNSAAYFLRGASKQLLRNYKGAIEDYDKAIELFPQFTQAYSAKGTVLLEEKDLLKAISDFDKAIKINPNYAKAYYGKGLAEERLDRKKDALQDFTKAFELGFPPAGAKLKDLKTDSSK